MVSQVFSGLQIHQIGRTKYVQFFEYQLYLIKAVKKKKNLIFKTQTSYQYIYIF